MKKTLWTLILVAAIVAGASCSALRHPDPKKYEGLDRKLDAFTYIEEGKLIALAAGTQVTRLREQDAYIPLSVGFANKTAPTLRIDRESFLLFDESGKRYPMAPYSEIRERYARGISDAEFTGFFEIWLGKWPTYTRVETSFFPINSHRTVQDFVELPSFHFFMENLYFPHPEGELKNKRFELHVKAKGLDDPVFVKFMVE